jgi:hypothetical protein
MGDLTFSYKRNRLLSAAKRSRQVYENNQTLISDFAQMSDALEGIGGKKLVFDDEAREEWLDGFFPLNDLRGMFLYIFDEIYSGMEEDGSYDKIVIQMPASEVMELAIFGGLEEGDARLVEGASIGLQEFPYSNWDLDSD